MRRTSPALLLMAGATLPLAQAARAEEPVIVVTGKGLATPPASPAYGTQELDRERLEQGASGRIEDALGAVAGVQQFRRSDSRSSNPSAQGITLRALGGNATSRTLVLLDGVPLADPFFGYIPLSALSPDRLSSVRVTRGAGSGAFGSGAVAGTIELTSADAAQLGRFSGSALLNDRAESELSANLAPRLGNGFAVLSGRWDRGQGFWTTPLAQRVPASVRARFDAWSLGLRGVAPLAPNVEVQARLSAFADRRTLRFRGADTGTSGQDASLRVVTRGAWQLDALAYLQARDFTNRVISATTFLPTLDQRATPSTGAGAKLEVRPPLGSAHVLRLGADWRSAQGHTIENTYRLGVVSGGRRAGGTNLDLGLFLEDDWTVGPLILTGGVRADRWTVRSGLSQASTLSGQLTSNVIYPSRSGWAESFRGGALLRATRRMSLRAAAYSNLRQPTLNELYRSFTVFPITTLANPALGNERLVGIEGGVDWRPARGLSLSATVFDNEVRHAIANVTLDAVTRQRQNVAAVRSRGVEASAGLTRGAITLDASLSYTSAHVRAPGQALDGKRPAQTPRWAVSATAAWRPRAGWTAALTLRHVGEQFEDDLQTLSLPAATTLDAFAQVPLTAGLSLILRGENLTGATILTRNSGDSVDVGAPRTVWAGIRVKMR